MMPYYGVSWYPTSTTDGDVLIVRMQTKDAVIEWLMMGFNPDQNFLADSMREVKDTLRDFLPDYRFKRTDMRVMIGNKTDGFKIMSWG